MLGERHFHIGRAHSESQLDEPVPQVLPLHRCFGCVLRHTHCPYVVHHAKFFPLGRRARCKVAGSSL